MVKKGVLILTILVMLVSAWTRELPNLIKGYHPSPAPVWQFKPVEIERININRSLFPKTSVGKLLSIISQNKAVLVLEKFLTNAYQYLDWNYYFFATHPRERVGVAEIEKLPWWLLPFFVLGLWRLPKDKGLLIKISGWFLGGVFLLSIFGLTDNLSSFILLPPIVVVIAYGVKGFLDYARNDKGKYDKK